MVRVLDPESIEHDRKQPKTLLTSAVGTCILLVIRVSILHSPKRHEKH
jgi:hypothetical protein